MLTFDWVEDPAIIGAELIAVGLEFRSFREPLNRCVRQVMIPSIRLNFAEGGRPSWPQLADETVLNKQLYGFPEDILVRTGKLQRKATQINAWTVDSEKAEYTGPVDVPYASVQQTGAVMGSWVLPPREFALVQDDDLDGMQVVFTNWVSERLALKGF